jgi:dGTPase
VAEAAALAHDIGHPPYGHIAEEELCELVDEHWDGSNPQGFEGNAQSFRIVTCLSLRATEHPGLNLTRATLGAVLKYPWARSTNTKDKKHKKWGAYDVEHSALAFAHDCPPGMDRSPEAEIMDWSDDIAYSVHDLEDFWKVGLIPLSRLVSEDKFRDEFLKDTSKYWWNKKGAESKAIAEMGTIAEGLLAYLPAGMREPYDGSTRQRAEARGWTSFLIGRYVRDAISIQGKKGSVSIVLQPSAVKEVALLKTLTKRYAIFNHALSAQQYGQRKQIKGLFIALLEMITKDRERSVLPPRMREALETAEKVAQDKKARHNAALRVIADFIASLTEPEAQSLYSRLHGIDHGLLSNPIVR